jgi:hypothetical protein
MRFFADAQNDGMGACKDTDSSLTLIMTDLGYTKEGDSSHGCRMTILIFGTASKL